MSSTLMVQGTTSDAGKSTLVAGLCRILARRGCKVAPFKPQNMALNSAVTSDGGEIGRAQALQAQACYLEPHTDMNPVLLKPCSDTGAQVIIHGKAQYQLDAQSYHRYKPIAMQAVCASHQRLAKQYDWIVAEGAGSPAEINLRDNDIANMGFAEHVDCPVILVADIDKGGVFAHLVGTLQLLTATERARIQGLVINKFRGDISLLQSGIDWLQDYTAKPVLGVVPYLPGFYLDAEDAINNAQKIGDNGAQLKVIVPVLPRISNHTDFDALRLHPQIDLQFIGPNCPVPSVDLIILPGSKNVRHDMQWLQDNGWPTIIAKHLRYGGKLIGICGGYQMLGATIDDPLGVEGLPGCTQGLNLLDITTELQPQKQLQQLNGTLAWSDTPVKGYAIHCGMSSGHGLARPAVQFADGSCDGALTSDGQVLGTYLHGLFDCADACQALLHWAGLDNPATAVDYSHYREQELERLADVLEQSLDLTRILPKYTRKMAV